jgi:beta-glucosidase
MPATLAVAATFSRAEAAANGAVIGRDARALGVDVILQPYINLYRDPTFERAYNTLGEDPVLTGTLAAEFVVAAQREGVMAQAKHFVAYDGADDAIVDGQALREVYLVPFKAVVDAGVASVMCSYNRINGIHSCGNEETLKRILRGEYGFRGFVTSDWGATHGAEYIARGLDMEQPGTGPGAFFALEEEPEEKGMTSEEVDDLEEIMFFGVPEEQGHPVPVRPESPPRPPEDVSAKLGQALARGSVVEADIDRAAGHVLGTAGALRLARSRAAACRRSSGHRRRMRASSGRRPSAVPCSSRTTACCRSGAPTSIPWRSSGPAHSRPSRS